MIDSNVGMHILQIELTEVTEDTIDLEEDIFDGEDELLQVINLIFFA